MGRPKLEESHLRRHTYGVRLTDDEDAVLRRHAKRLGVPPTTAVRMLALERAETVRPSRPTAADIRFELRRVGAALDAIAQGLKNRRVARRPNTEKILTTVREAATTLAEVLARGARP